MKTSPSSFFTTLIRIVAGLSLGDIQSRHYEEMHHRVVLSLTAVLPQRSFAMLRMTGIINRHWSRLPSLQMAEIDRGRMP